MPKLLDSGIQRDTPPGTDQAGDVIEGRHEIGAALGVSTTTLTTLMQAGRLPFEVWHAPPSHKLHARRSEVEAAAADQSWRPRRGRGPAKAGPELIRDPSCRRYEKCLDKYARQDRKGRPIVSSAGEMPGWSCAGCPRFEPAGPRDATDVRLLCLIAYLVTGLDPGDIIRGEVFRDTRSQALPAAE